MGIAPAKTRLEPSRPSLTDHHPAKAPVSLAGRSSSQFGHPSKLCGPPAPELTSPGRETFIATGEIATSQYHERHQSGTNVTNA
jgi:hypothetical protein